MAFKVNCRSDGFHGRRDRFYQLRHGAIAQQLDANVQGDDGELYTGESTAHVTSPKSWIENAPRLSLILSIVAVFGILIALGIDRMYGDRFPGGTPSRLPFILVVGGVGAGGAICLILSVIAAASTFAEKLKPRRPAWIALAINAIVILYLYVRSD
ncbi:MAG: hypothetical protein WEB58_12990 [Planctomycetaceae bacterium]